MRVFWAFLGVLIVAAGVLLAMRGGSGPSGNAAPANRLTIDAGSGPVPEPTTETASEPDPESGSATEPTPAPTPTGTTEPAGSPDADETPVVVEVGVADESSPKPVPEGEPAPLADDLAADSPVETPTPETVEDNATEVAGTDAEGGLKLNDRFTVPGSGTKDDPYKINFELLVALEHDYEPATEGKGAIPEWIKPLNGKVVQITGFIGFPFIAPQADECMVMLNQWDGCCIGVPPTPYDAIEVKLGSPVDLSRGVPNYGVVVGVFRTDPYLVNGWLIGLYVMDEAVMETAGSRNQAGF